MNYAGNSMTPVLKTGDTLRVVPYEHRKIRVGDVAAFRSPYGRAVIAHRVVSIDPRGVKTKGDNNLAIDDWVLDPNEIIGRVVSLQRNRKTIKILSGFWGRMYALALGAAKRIDLVLSTILRPPYRWFAQTGIFRNLFSRWIRTRITCFKRGEGMEMQVRLGRRVIGRRLPGQDRWHIRRPFKLFVDDVSLSGNNPDDLSSM